MSPGFATYTNEEKVFVATNSGLSISTNGGTTFVNNSFIWDEVSVRSVTGTGNHIYAATLKGLAVSYDNGNTFAIRTTLDGLPHNKTWRVNIVDQKIYVATMEGVAVSEDSGVSFKQLLTGDGVASTVVMGGFAELSGKLLIGTANGLAHGPL